MSHPAATVRTGTTGEQTPSSTGPGSLKRQCESNAGEAVDSELSARPTKSRRQSAVHSADDTQERQPIEGGPEGDRARNEVFGLGDGPVPPPPGGYDSTIQVSDDEASQPSSEGL